MLGKELLSYVDHTLLRPTATWDDIKEICDAGVAYKTASVCIPPDFVASAHEAYPDLNVCTVIGFPLGYETTEVKVAETKQALAEGASEIDMVINLGDVRLLSKLVILPTLKRWPSVNVSPMVGQTTLKLLLVLVAVALALKTFVYSRSISVLM